MSRSYKKTPICGITRSKSEAEDKKIWHSRFRVKAKQNLAVCRDFDNLIDTHFRDVSNPWSMAKDGRQWLDISRNPEYKKYTRK